MQFQEIITQLDKAAINNSLQRNCKLNPEIKGIASIDVAISGNLSYIEGGKFAAQIATTEASALILPLDESLQSQATIRNIAWIATSQPRLLFARVISLFYRPFQPASGKPLGAVDHT